MRMFKSFLTFTLLFTSFTSPASAVEIPLSFQVKGAGFGHGVGMSQMGARSMALAGQTPIQILQYFYKDVLVEPRNDTETIRVNIGHILSSTKIFTKTAGALVQLFSGDIGDQIDATPLAVFSNNASLNFSVLGNNVIPSIALGKKSTAFMVNRSFTIRWSGTRNLSGIDALMSVTNSGATKKYRYGQMAIRAVKDGVFGYRLELTNSLRLSDEYLWGVSEMPSFWPVAAIQAQVIASRTYALSKLGKYRFDCDCDIYSQISDQNFLGFAKEAELKYGVLWKKAVTDTAGLTIIQNGLPINAYFFSSSGGKTESALNAWGTARAYTQIVADPGSLDSILNPRFTAWNRAISQEVVAAAFLLPDVVSLELLTRNESGTVGQIRATSSGGAQKILRGETFRSRTKIPSAYFELVGMQN